MQHPAALPACRDTCATAKRHEEQAHLAAVAVLVFQHVHRDVLYCGVLPGAGPGICLDNPAVDAAHLQVRVGLTGDQRIGQGPNAVGKDDVRPALRRVGLVDVGTGIVGQTVFRSEVIPLVEACEREGIGKDGGLPRLGRLLHIDALVLHVVRRDDVVGLGCGDQFHFGDAVLVLAGERHPGAYGLPRRHGVRFHGQFVPDEEIDGFHQVLARGADRGDHIAVVVVQIDVLHIAGNSVDGFVDLAGFRVDAEKIAPRIAEIALLPVDDTSFQGLRRFPGRHLFLRKVGIVGFQVVHDVCAVAVEVQRDARIPLRIGDVEHGIAGNSVSAPGDDECGHDDDKGPAHDGPI